MKQGTRLTRFPLKRPYQTSPILDVQINLLEQTLLPSMVFWDNIRKGIKHGK